MAHKPTLTAGAKSGQNSRAKATRPSVRKEYTMKAYSDPELSETWAKINRYLNDAACPI